MLDDEIKKQPMDVVEEIINNISLDSVSTRGHQWYNKPDLANKSNKEVLETTYVDLFPFFAQRLLSLELTDENIPLAVLLAELMTANKPGDDEPYFVRKKWDNIFTSHIQSFKNTYKTNPWLDVILWALYSKTTSSYAALTEVFHKLPPYLQVRIVKKLFKALSEKKIHHTAESLYNLLSGGGKAIYLPLEITFAYLKLREKDPSLTLNNIFMLKLLGSREDSDEWIGIKSVLTPCAGRRTMGPASNDWSIWLRDKYYNGTINKVEGGKTRIFIPYKMITRNGELTEYNNKYYNQTIQQIQLIYEESEYSVVKEQNGVSYYFDKNSDTDLFSLVIPNNLKYDGWENFVDHMCSEDYEELFCECRLSDKVDDNYHFPFYWCRNYPCFRPPVRYLVDNEWEHYTILDFMRILGISPDYINKNGKRTQYGHYIILSSYLKSFANFYEHLKCRECGKLMKPIDISNFAFHAVTEFSCENEQCSQKGFKVYLNHCFNKQRCDETIDSRDSMKCPNGQYICPQCGACCSTENFRQRISNLNATGGYISERLKLFVDNGLGHWEKDEYFCYQCGRPLTNEDGKYKCNNCGVLYYYRKPHKQDFAVDKAALTTNTEELQ